MPPTVPHPVRPPVLRDLLVQRTAVREPQRPRLPSSVPRSVVAVDTYDGRQDHVAPHDRGQVDRHQRVEDELSRNEHGRADGDSDALRHRPQLRAGIEMCYGEGAVLLIAKLDRLVRNEHFLSGLAQQPLWQDAAARRRVCNPHELKRPHSRRGGRDRPHRRCLRSLAQHSA